VSTDRQHLSLCLRNLNAGWLTLLGPCGDVGNWRAIACGAQSLDAHIEPVLRRIGITPSIDFTFSCARNANQVMESPLHEERPTIEVLKTILPGYSISVPCPIAHPDYPDIWASIWRDPRGGLSTEANTRFADSVLIDQIEEWFKFYTPKRIETGRAGALELYVRRNWSASALLPAQFPARPPVPKLSRQDTDRRKAVSDARRRKEQAHGQLASQGYVRSESAWARPATEE
jgi:hypothetical protein